MIWHQHLDTKFRDTIFQISNLEKRLLHNENHDDFIISKHINNLKEFMYFQQKILVSVSVYYL